MTENKDKHKKEEEKKDDKQQFNVEDVNNSQQSMTVPPNYVYHANPDNFNIKNLDSMDKCPSALENQDHSELIIKQLQMIKHQLLCEALESVGVGNKENCGELIMPDFNYETGVAYENYTKEIVVYFDNSKSRRWKAAVRDIGDFFKNNVNAYGSIVKCPLLNNKEIMADEIGFINACLWRAQIVPTNKGPYTFTDLTGENGDFYDMMTNGGFSRCSFSLETAVDFAICNNSNSGCIFGGRNDSVPMAYTWTINKASDGMPQRMPKDQYTVQWNMVNDEASFGDEFGPISGSAGQFTGKSTSEKWSMCGLDGASPNSAQVESRLVNVNINGSTARINSALVADLQAIAQESAQYGFNFKVSSSYRTTPSAGGNSRHQYGVAVDINAGSGGNPWFSHNFTSSSWTYNSSGAAPWGIKSCPFHGKYDKSKCIWSWDHPVVQIFNKHGWGWGGAYGDVMHFSISTYPTKDGHLGGK